MRTRTGTLNVIASLGLVSATAIAMMSAAPACAQEARRTYDIEAQPLAAALIEFSRQSEVAVSAPSSLVKGKTAAAVRGSYTAAEALRLLLDGNGLHFRAGRSGGYVLESVGNATADSASSEEARSAEIVVTGTRIRGATESTQPTITLTRQAIAEAGHSSLQDVFESLPQNFDGVTPDGARGSGSSPIATGNQTQYITAVDLRGLGAESTLTLLNGSRLAGGLDGRAVDISSIPLSVIESIDVATGGASAVYGSDAVAGVVNLKTRRSFSGLQTDFTVSGPTRFNDGRQGEASALIGIADSGGNLILSYDYRKEDALDIGNSDLIAPNASGSIYSRLDTRPNVRQHSGYVSATRDIVPALRFDVQALYTKKDVTSTELSTISGATNQSSTKRKADSTQVFSSGSLEWEISPSYSLRSELSYSSYEQTGVSDADTYYPGFHSISSVSIIQNNQDLSGGFYISGASPIFGTSVSVVAGAEHRSQRFHEALGGARPRLLADGERRIVSLFGELQVPIGNVDGKPRFEALLSGRYDRYDGAIGDTFNPRLSGIWRLTPSLKLKGSWSTSFRAPSIIDLGGTYSASILNRPSSSGVNVPALILFGNNEDLTPERSKSLTLDIEYAPAFLQNTTLTASYYRINYRDRLAFPTAGSDIILFLQRASQFPTLLNLQPTAADVQKVIEEATSIYNGSGLPWNPASGAQGLLNSIPSIVIFDDRYRNISVEKVSGLDVQISSKQSALGGELLESLNVNYTIDHRRRLTPTSPAFSLLNEVGKPVDFRANLRVGYRRKTLGAHITTNYVHGYNDPVAGPNIKVGSWTTFDGVLEYSPSLKVADGSESGFSISLSVKNIFNKKPPIVSQTLYSGFTFDSANASGIGRFISLRVGKRW